jgi:hypothetical protein
VLIEQVPYVTLVRFHDVVLILLTGNVKLQKAKHDGCDAYGERNSKLRSQIPRFTASMSIGILCLGRFIWIAGLYLGRIRRARRAHGLLAGRVRVLRLWSIGSAPRSKPLQPGEILPPSPRFRGRVGRRHGRGAHGRFHVGVLAAHRGVLAAKAPDLCLLPGFQLLGCDPPPRGDDVLGHLGYVGTPARQPALWLADDGPGCHHLGGLPEFPVVRRHTPLLLLLGLQQPVVVVRWAQVEHHLDHHRHAVDDDEEQEQQPAGRVQGGVVAGDGIQRLQPDQQAPVVLVLGGEGAFFLSLLVLGCLQGFLRCRQLRLGLGLVLCLGTGAVLVQLVLLRVRRTGKLSDLGGVVVVSLPVRQPLTWGNYFAGRPDKESAPNAGSGVALAPTSNHTP